ncbi:MAG: tRNA preQ1(34) S-adenosylmethionine ribosyltransferase-isomerase QueA [Deltaproteobacteria bacterium]|nr:tRNA preQ1(34) S-adenosylmethionine ribosyltransferase-isomerase QueA [Deltaproteobacteria bacterium]
MQLSDFDYPLPSELIAQYPPPQRGSSRMMVIDRALQTVVHESFAAVGAYLRSGDLLVINDTRVIPARLFGRKEKSGGQVEIFLVHRRPGPEELWSCLCRSSKRPCRGAFLSLGEELRAEVVGEEESSLLLLRFLFQGDFQELLERTGRVPLPPYIRRQDTPLDRERYQTVFARQAGAVAAPTAGLHFTPAIVASLAARGVGIASLTLHVGIGTFLPVRSDNPLDHEMHGEYYSIPAATAERIRRTKEEGGRVCAVGTTVTRALETAAAEEGQVRCGAGVSRLFIYPGFCFRIVDALLTNFHLPKSTLLMLVSAFAGRDLILDAYRKACAERYRFYSYGDCMLIL